MDSSELFLTRDVKDPLLIERCKAILDDWSDRIPFSPIKKLGSKTEFVSAVEHATYKTKVTTQIEKRWLEEHEVPYNEERLPASPLPKSSIDPWKISFSPIADFSKHHRTQDVVETRRVYDCSTCRATGEVTCSECEGLREVRCSDCNGYGHNECSGCKGSGHIRETRTIPRQTKCGFCDGKGYKAPWVAGGKEETCFHCSGRGSVIEDFEEEYYVPCTDCASSGKITCSTCRGHGKVTCGECGGSGKVECKRCDGQRRLLSYVTVEVEEDSSSKDNQYISPTLPKFKKKDHPLSNLKGEVVFTQDESRKIDQLKFCNQPAAAVLSREVELCRATHDGHVLRQRIEIEACVLVEYRYRHGTKDYSIYINPEHKLVEDLEGPVQAFIENADALAETALKDKRYEDAYRLITRGLCMDEASEAEKKLRDEILEALVVSYRKIALVSWFGAAIVWSLVNGLPSNFQISWWFLLSLTPLLLATQVFSENLGVQLSGPKDRVVPAVLISIAAFLSGVVIGSGTSWTNWISFVSLIIVAGAFGLIRSKARAKLQKLEAHFTTFPNPQALEAYVLKFDPKPAFSSRIKFALVFLVVLLAIQPILMLVSGFNSWALDRTRIQFNVQIAGKATKEIPEILFNGKSIHSGDKVEPGKGIIGVTDIHFMPFRSEIKVSYGSAANVGTIELTPAHGQVTISSDPQDADFQLWHKTRDRSDNQPDWSGKLPFQKDIPTGDYQLITIRKGWEIKTDISVSRGTIITNQTEFPYSSIEVTSEPTGLVISGGGDELGKTPLFLQVKPGQYALTATDGENDLIANITVGPKEAAKHDFKFHYGSVQLSSIPAGATVIRKGKEAGKTPLTLNHIPAGNTPVELQLQGYVSTNFPLEAVEGIKTDIAVKLTSERFLQTMKQAQNEADSGRFEDAIKSAARAIEIDPGDERASDLWTNLVFKAHCQNAEIYLLRNQFSEALEEVKKAETFSQNSSVTAQLKEKISKQKLELFASLIRRAKNSFTNKAYNDAANQLAEAEKLNPGSSEAASLQGQIHIEQLRPIVREKNWQELRQHFRNSKYSETVTWKYQNSLATIQNRTAQILNRRGAWNLLKEFYPDNDTVTMRLDAQAGSMDLSSYKNRACALMLSDLGGGMVEIRFKFFVYESFEPGFSQVAPDILQACRNDLFSKLKASLGEPMQSN